MAAPTIETPPCDFCGRSDFDVVIPAAVDRRHWLPGRFDVVRCTGCHLVRTHPRPTPEAISAYYPGSYVCFTADESERGGVYSALRAAVRTPYELRYGSADPTRAAPPGGGRLLDVGCGAGHFLARMKNLGWEAWGVEPSETTANAARERTGLPAERIVVGTAEDASFPPASFDLVTMAHVLEHLHRPTAVLRKIHGWLRPGGELRIWAPNFASVERRVFGRYWFGLDVPRHLFHFEPASLRTILREVGFEVRRIIPQWQVNTLGWSIPHVTDALRRRRRDFRESMRLYYASLPLAAVLLPLGVGGALDATAVKMSEHDASAAT